MARPQIGQFAGEEESAREDLRQAFLDRTGWGQADRTPLAQDASDRSYLRLTLAETTAILMDAPPGPDGRWAGDDPRRFVKIARLFAGHGIRVPAILAEDAEDGFLLLEDLGHQRLADLARIEPAQARTHFEAATDMAIAFADLPVPDYLANVSARDWAEAAAVAPLHYARLSAGKSIDAGSVTAALTKALATHADGPRVLIHRDFHAENLMVLPQGGLAVIDFQLAQAGQPGYDLLSLTEDARRDMDPELARDLSQRYASALGLGGADWDARLAVIGTQRALRILGQFARLSLEANKHRYLAFLPRVWRDLQRHLMHDALAETREALADLPAPEGIA